MRIIPNWLKSSFSKPKEGKINHLRILMEGSKRPSLSKDYFTSNYLFQEKRKVFFTVNSGLCNLQCPYCITERPTIKSNLDKEDFLYIFKYFGENIYFIFSGLGDFFCGYSEKDQLLRYILRHDVMIFLDINGLDIKELQDQDLEGKQKIDMIDISYHYGTMKNRNSFAGGLNLFKLFIPICTIIILR